MRLRLKPGLSPLSADCPTNRPTPGPTPPLWSTLFTHISPAAHSCHQNVSSRCGLGQSCLGRLLLQPGLSDLHYPYKLPPERVRKALLTSQIKSTVFIISSPREAWAFHELRRYHTRPLRLNWGPKNVHFGKMHFRDLNINVKIFTVPKNSPKTVQSSKTPKNDQNHFPTSRT